MAKIQNMVLKKDRDSFTECYYLIGGCQMISCSSKLPDDMALLLPKFSHNLVPIEASLNKENFDPQIYLQFLVLLF